jgi:hypothetical protein
MPVADRVSCSLSCASMEKCALALCNLSTYRPAREELMKVDAIDALAAISGTGTELSRRICSVALCNLVNDIDHSKRACTPTQLCLQQQKLRTDYKHVPLMFSASLLT